MKCSPDAMRNVAKMLLDMADAQSGDEDEDEVEPMGKEEKKESSTEKNGKKAAIIAALKKKGAKK